ncbi:hypothetical protein OF001_U210067 [Pseudomonas sp. OF001]|nr:hypothetical protein OF001_U210067 [Pseudomonas sp. OF001]
MVGALGGRLRAGAAVQARLPVLQLAAGQAPRGDPPPLAAQRVAGQHLAQGAALQRFVDEPGEQPRHAEFRVVALHQLQRRPGVDQAGAPHPVEPAAAPAVLQQGRQLGQVPALRQAIVGQARLADLQQRLAPAHQVADADLGLADAEGGKVLAAGRRAPLVQREALAPVAVVLGRVVQQGAIGRAGVAAARQLVARQAVAGQPAFAVQPAHLGAAGSLFDFAYENFPNPQAVHGPAIPCWRLMDARLGLGRPAGHFDLPAFEIGFPYGFPPASLLRRGLRGGPCRPRRRAPEHLPAGAVAADPPAGG